MGFHGSPSHIELSGNLGVVATLQEQVDDLLFAGTQPNSLFLHFIHLVLGIARPGERGGAFHIVIASRLPFFATNDRFLLKPIFHRHLQADSLLRDSKPRPEPGRNVAISHSAVADSASKHAWTLSTIQLL